MLNSQQHQPTSQQHHQQQQHQHQQQLEPHTTADNGNTPAGYFIFDDLTTALQERSNNDQAISQQQIQQQQKFTFAGDGPYHFKTLVPSVAAGAIIGKGGETIAAVQKETGARVKMSKSHDFYPGTSERVALITGSLEAIMDVLEFIMDKIREKPDLQNKLTDNEAKQAQERDRQVKILVPNSTAGMIIGKAGAYIKQIKEESGSYVQISQKPKDVTLQERCITVIGDTEKNKIAIKLILDKIMEDPQSGTCLNVSYADINGPVANFNPTGSPYAANQSGISTSNASLNSSVSGPGLLVNGNGINLSLNLGQPSQPNPAVTSQLLDHIKAIMRASGYSDPATNEVCQALAILAKYGVLGGGASLAHTNGSHHPLSYLGVTPLEHQVSAGGVFGAIGQVNLESYVSATSPTAQRNALERYDGQFDPFRHGSQATTPISINNNSFGLATTNAQAIGAAAAAAAAQSLLSKSPTPGDIGGKDTKNVEVPEIIIGAILGPNGRSLIEIQHISGAIIQISKKGMFATGTRNRIVTISGQPNAIAMAHILIEQKIQQEEDKRARQNAAAGIVQ